MRSEKFELFSPRRRGAPIGEIDDFALRLSFDRGVRFFDKTFQAVREPMIASRGSAFAVHALLHDGPAAFAGDEEAVEIEIEAVLDGSAIDFCYKPAGACQAFRIDADTLRYEATVDDPGTWTRPWTLSFPWRRDPGYGFYEYACHEGNYALHNIMSGGRADDQAAQGK